MEKSNRNKKKTKKKPLNLKLLIILCILQVVTLVSLCFSTEIEYMLKIRPNLSQISTSDLEVHFVDVGQGDCILIRFPDERTMIVDSGTKASKSELINYIDNVFFYKSEKVFDYALLTHSDADHSGNMEYIIENYTIKNFYRPRAYAVDVEESTGGMKISTATYSGVISALLASEIQNVFYTDEPDLDIEDANGNRIVTFYSHNMDNLEDSNAYSPIIVIESYGKRICLTGDAPKSTEYEVIDSYDLPDVDVLKLAHHGSYTSTSLEFLNAITPEYAVVSVGENSYGHPSEATLITLASYDELADKNTYNNLLTTQNDGNIVFHFNQIGDISYLTIDNVNDYIFVPYYVIVVLVSAVLITNIYFVVFRKTFKK